MARFSADWWYKYLGFSFTIGKLRDDIIIEPVSTVGNKEKLDRADRLKVNKLILKHSTLVNS